MVMSRVAPASAAPTLWRTCRALANRQRLLMLRSILMHPNCSVSEIAHRMRVSMPVASQYLRTLNARGVLRAERIGRWVLYRVQPDPSNPQAIALLPSLSELITTSLTALETAFAALTGFTHPRRIAVIQILAGGSAGINTLSIKTGMSKQSVLRHLRKLRRRGYIYRRDHQYHIQHPPSRLMKTLLKLALS
jgi:DNA-binding transcriptional ArsR family regulator